MDTLIFPIVTILHSLNNPQFHTFITALDPTESFHYHNYNTINRYINKSLLRFDYN